MLESPILFRLARNMEARVKYYWVPMENSVDAGAWNVDLHRRLNDQEIEEMINLIGFVDPIRLNVYRGPHVLELFKEWDFLGQILEGSKIGQGGARPSRPILWSLKIPSKVVFFLWTAVRDCLPSIDTLQSRGMIFPNICLLCMWEVESINHLFQHESINHLFLHYPFASKVWVLLLKEIDLAWVFPTEINLLISSRNIRGISKKREDSLKVYLFCYLLGNLA